MKTRYLIFPTKESISFVKQFERYDNIDIMSNYATFQKLSCHRGVGKVM